MANQNLQDDEWEDAPAAATTQPTASNSEEDWEDAPSQAAPSSFMGINYDPSKNDFKNKGLLKTLWDEFTKTQDPSAHAMMQSITYPGGLVSDAGIEALKRFTGHDGLGKDEWMKALAGNATPATEQLKDAGYGPLAQYGLGIPYGVATDPLASVGGSALRGSEDALRDAALSATERHLRPTPRVAQAIGPEGMKDIASTVLDSGAMKPFSKAEQTAAKLENLKDESGALMEDMINSSKGTANPVDIANRFENEIIAPLRDVSGQENLIGRLEKQKNDFLAKYAPAVLTPQEQAMVDTLPSELQNQVKDSLLEAKAPGGQKGPMNASQLEKQKRIEQHDINYYTDSNLRQKAQKDWARLLKEEGEKVVGDPAFTPAKKTYGNAAAAQDMLDRTAALTNGGTGLLGHLTDLGVAMPAIESLANGHVAGVPLVALRQFLKGRMASGTANVLNDLSKFAGSKYAPLIDSAIRRQSINGTNPWANALQQSGGTKQ
jgi:hypothetical protein